MWKGGMIDAMAAAGALEPLIRASVDEAEGARRLPRAVIAAMAEAGVFRQMAPRQSGGDEVDPVSVLNFVEAVSRVDGSAGWVAMIGSGGGFLAGYLETHVGRQIFADPNACMGGNIGFPGGRADAVPGGYRVSGRWPFVSGCEHSTYLSGNTRVYDGDVQRLSPDGSPKTRIMVFPRGDASIVDTWWATGLRATGSHDVVVSDIFVPEERSLWWADGPKQPGPLYPVRFMIVAHAAHALGIARAAIDAVVELAEHKTPARSSGVLRTLPQMQTNLAQAEALVQAARRFTWQTTAEVWDLLCQRRPVTLRHRALLRLAMTYAVQSAAQAVDLMWAAAGASPVYTSSPLERCFRDIHVATQHAAVGIFSLETIGSALLGPDATTAQGASLI